MNRADAQEYTQALGQIVSGSWRQVALGVRLGVPKALGVTTRQWVEEDLGGYVRLSLPERREAVSELTAAERDGGMGLSGRDAAQVLGVDHETVRRDVAHLRQPGCEQQEHSGGLGAFAPSLDDRIAHLPHDLAERVREGMNLDEAERVVQERADRMRAYRDRILESMRTLARMIGYPVPDVGLTEKERALLARWLELLKESGEDYGYLG